MSFRLFVYYCAVSGAWSGFVGWALARSIVHDSGDSYFSKALHDSIYGMFLGLCVACGLSLLDGIFNYWTQFGKIIGRVFPAAIVGAFGGVFGGFIGSSLFQAARYVIGATLVSEIVFVIGWIIVGFLLGFSISFVEVLRSVMTRKDMAGSFRKLRNCVIGGTVGGILGGLVAVTIAIAASKLFDRDNMWTPTALGFVAIGACIGLLVGLAQVILKEAWIRVEAGFRPGREMLLAKERTSVGRAEGSDIALFGDMGVEKTHAFIVLEGGRYYLVDQGTPGGSFVNDQKVDGRMILNGGDLITLGKSALRFNERAKR